MLPSGAVGSRHVHVFWRWNKNSVTETFGCKSALVLLRREVARRLLRAPRRSRETLKLPSLLRNITRVAPELFIEWYKMQVTDCSVDVCSHTNTECQDVFHWFYSVWSNSVRSQRQAVWSRPDRTGPWDIRVGLRGHRFGLDGNFSDWLSWSFTQKLNTKHQFISFSFLSLLELPLQIRTSGSFSS